MVPMTDTATRTTAPADTHTACAGEQTVHRMMDGMTITGAIAPVVSGYPDPEAIAAKKARRRLGPVRYDNTQSGGHAPHHFGDDGYDAFGYDMAGNFNPAHRLTDIPTPFTHCKKD